MAAAPARPRGLSLPTSPVSRARVYNVPSYVVLGPYPLRANTSRLRLESWTAVELSTTDPGSRPPRCPTSAHLLRAPSRRNRSPRWVQVTRPRGAAHTVSV